MRRSARWSWTLSLICFASVLAAAASAAGKVVMPWMCLERCEENIGADLAQIHDHREEITAVSFEAYDVGDEADLVWNGFTPVNDAIISMHLTNVPMITTASLRRLRTLFRNPTGFVHDAVKAAVKHNYAGYNIDFEPDDQGNATDAAQFAVFLDLFAKALHAKGKTLSVDVAGWNAIWDFQLIAAVSVDKVITMDTYVKDDAEFLTELNRAVQDIGIAKLGVGLECDVNLTDSQVAYRFQAIQSVGALEIDIWQSPIASNFWSYLKEFLHAP